MRPASCRLVLAPANALTLKNAGATFAGDVDVFSLIGTSGRIPPPTLPEPGDNLAVIDLKEFGVRQAGSNIQFAISTFGTRAIATYPAGFEVQLDTDRDGVFDAFIWNQELTGFAATGQTVVYFQSSLTGASGAAFYAAADLRSGNMILTAPLAPLGLTPGTTFDAQVIAYDNYFTGLETDSVEGMKFTPATPKFRVTSGIPFGSVAKGPLLNVPFTKNGAVTAAQSSETGLLMMYRRNAGDESQAFVIP